MCNIIPTSSEIPRTPRTRRIYKHISFVEAVLSQSVYSEEILTEADLSLVHQTILADGFIIKPLKKQEYAVFALLPIPAGAWFGEYQGELLTEAQMDALYWKNDGDDNDHDGNSSDTDINMLEEDRQWIESRKRTNQTLTGDYNFDVGGNLSLVVKIQTKHLLSQSTLCQC